MLAAISIDLRIDLAFTEFVQPGSAGAFLNSAQSSQQFHIHRRLFFLYDTNRRADLSFWLVANEWIDVLGVSRSTCLNCAGGIETEMVLLVRMVRACYY